MVATLALMRGSQRLLSPVPPDYERGERATRDELHALREIGLSLRGEAHEMCILAQETRWLSQWTREQARKQRARAASLRALISQRRDLP